MDDDGFYLGELRDQRGLVPSNFLTEAPQDYDPSQPRQKRIQMNDKGVQERHRDSSYYSRLVNGWYSSKCILKELLAYTEFVIEWITKEIEVCLEQKGLLLHRGLLTIGSLSHAIGVVVSHYDCFHST